MLLCLAVTGCAEFDVKGSELPAPPVPPDEKQLAELADAAFKMTKLTGAVEVSPVRATHDAQWGDWAFCIKSNDPQQLPPYGVLIYDGKILTVRSHIIIDGCDKETYHSVGNSSAPGKSRVDLPQPSPHRHQTRAP
jgi:hypothetical protein